MQQAEFNNLKRGDIIRGTSGDSYVIETVLVNSRWNQFVAVKTTVATNPAEWEKVQPENLPCPCCGRSK